jgi:hypothetical protein
MRRRFRNGAGVKGSVKRSKTVPDLSRLMYYSAKRTLKKCRQTEKETEIRISRANRNLQKFAYNGQSRIDLLFQKEEQRRTEEK